MTRTTAKDDARTDTTDRRADRPTTRRRALRATAVGVGTIAGLGSGVAAGNGGCDVSESERQAVREEWADPGLVLDTLEQQEALNLALQQQGLVDGTTDGVLVYAPVVDCQPIPEYRIFRQVDAGGYLTIAMRPQSAESVATYTPGGGSEKNPPCEYVADNCWDGCEANDCCECDFSTTCGCTPVNIPCDPYCCIRCECECNGLTCLRGCDIHVQDPIETEIPENIGELIGGCC